MKVDLFMSYYLNIGGWCGIFAVPNSIVDEHIKNCGEKQLKIILWALRHGNEVFEKSRISLETGIDESSIDTSMEYWIKNGVIKKDGNNLIPANGTQEEKQPEIVTQTIQVPPSQPITKRRMLRPDGLYIAQRMKESVEIETVIRETENILGKTISPSLAAVLVNAHDDYALPVEVILLIINYTVSIGKTTTSYIESLSKEWSESGIFSMEMAEIKLHALNERTLAWRKISQYLGIAFRSPTKKEDEFAYKWIVEFKFSSEMIIESYERCVNNIGKLQMPYMDKILSKWHSKGLTTVKEVLGYENIIRNKKDNNKSTFDMESIDKIDFFNNNN